MRDGARIGLAVVLAAGLVIAGGRTCNAAGQAAPTQASVVGAWTGIAQTPNGAATVKIDLRLQEGKLDASIELSIGTIQVRSAALVDDKLTVLIDYETTPGTLVATVKGDRMDGTWSVGDATGPFALSRGGSSPQAAAGDPVSGSWAGAAVLGGQTYPFTAELRLAGEAVTGEMKAPAGTVPLASGSWKEGTLLLAFPYVGGEPISMTGQIKDGALSGVIDYNRGEATGTFSATKKQ